MCCEKAFVRWMGKQIKTCASFELFAKNEGFICCGFVSGYLSP